MVNGWFMQRWSHMYTPIQQRSNVILVQLTAWSLVAFRCAYCYYLNPAKEKKLPVATSEPEATPAPQQPMPENASKPTTVDEREETPETQ